jgi:hypothetical protein
MGKFIDETGNQYTDWLVWGKADKDKWGQNKWLCLCLHCGNWSNVTGANLRQGLSRGCGCRHREEVRERMLSDRNPMKNVFGSKHPRWEGGKSFEPYCPKWTRAFKEWVRGQYDRRCFLCGVHESVTGKKHDCHHTNYNKQQGCSGIEWSIVPLCKSCHSKTRGNREYWMNLFDMALKAILE